MEKWQEASDMLVRSLAIQPSEEAYNNLAIANYHLGDIQSAADYFQRSAQPSDYAMYSHIKCLIELARTEEAKAKLDAFSEEDEEFVGQVEMAELYVELDCFEQAVEWFEKGWKLYWKTPDWVGRFVYALLKINKAGRAHEILNEVIQQKAEDICDADKEAFDDDWTEDEKAEYIQELAEEQKAYEGLLQRITGGYIPPMKYDTSLRYGCYLFRCERHQHPDSERWEQGKTITLTYDEYDARGDIKIMEIKENQKIVFQWGADGEGHEVTITLAESGISESIVEVTEEGFNENEQDWIRSCTNGREGSP
ncbi:hypothetical protein BGX30_000581 [Mortierella sp. GBA39]|nr:hypothetical protein BGX30_000581 [Mortierella sp. GBA39]